MSIKKPVHLQDDPLCFSKQGIRKINRVCFKREKHLTQMLTYTYLSGIDRGTVKSRLAWLNIQKLLKSASVQDIRCMDLTMERTALQWSLWHFFWVRLCEDYEPMWVPLVYRGGVDCWGGSSTGTWIISILTAGPDTPWWISWIPNLQAEGKSFTLREPHFFLVRSQMQINCQVSHYPLG